MPSPILIRCDGSPSIGLGHVARCVALALALRERGLAPVFAMRDLPGPAVALVRARGFVVALQADGGTEQTRAVARRERACVVLVDSYATTSDDLGALRAGGYGLAVIDDVADRDLTAADWLLNQNADAEALPYRLRPGCRALFGPAYALLRPEFAQARAALSRRFTPTDGRVLITFGGGEGAEPLLAAAVGALAPLPGPLHIRVAGGGDAQALPTLSAAAAASPHRVSVLGTVGDMAAQMAWADLAVTAGGSTCGEMCCLGLPMIVSVLSPDQGPGGAALERTGCARRMPGLPTEGAGAAALAEAAGALLASPAQRERMSAQAQRLVDGAGAGRAAESLAQLARERAGDV